MGKWAGDLSDSRLDELLSKEILHNESMIRHVVHALFITGNPRFVDFAISFCKDKRYSHIWYEIYELLAKIKNQQVEDFFIDFCVNDEKERLDLTKIVDRWFRELEIKN